MSDQNQKNVTLPKYWIQRVSKSRNGKTYYFNTKTKQSVWRLSDVLKSDCKDQKGTKTNADIVKSDQISPEKNKLGVKNAKSPNPAQDRLKAIRSSLEYVKPPLKLNKSPEKLRKIQSTTSFKPNIAQHRLKVLQTSLKNDRELKEKLLAENQEPPPIKQVTKDSLLSNNNNNISKEVTEVTNKNGIKESAIKTDSTSILTKTMAKYREFVSQLHNSKVDQVDESENQKRNQSPFELKGDSGVKNSTVLEDSLVSEPMDWEYTSDELSNDHTNNESLNKNGTIPLENFETMEEYLNYKNLINDEDIEQRYFYVVVDTNVFISNLDFIEKLTKINFKNYGHPVIIVPYIVLQELDKIKMRFETKFTSLSTKAKAAIHYLNTKLKDHHKQFCGQSAKDDAKKLIPITSQDDDIVNCLLQVKEMAKGAVILLSDDKNLRNKVLVSEINSYSTSELEAKKDSLQFFTPNR